MYVQNIKVMNQTMNQICSASNTQEMISFPESIILGVTQKCNFDCVMCRVWREKSSACFTEAMLDKLDPVLPFVRSMHITGGEPLMYDHLQRLLTMNAKNEVVTSIVTNGSLLTPSMISMLIDLGVNKLKLSIDAASAKTYNTIRSFNFMKVVKNVAALGQEKARRRVRHPHLELGFVAMKRNIHELTRYVVLAHELGADSVRVAHCFTHTPDVKDDGLRDIPDVSDAEMLKAAGVAKELGIALSLPKPFKVSQEQQEASGYKARVRKQCHDPWKTLWINHNGRGKLCCQGGKGDYGDFNELDFMSFWNHPQRMSVRKFLNTSVVPPECKGCGVLGGCAEKCEDPESSQDAA